MPVKLKICEGCGKKFNEIVEQCPYCNSKSFSEYNKNKTEGKDKTDKLKSNKQKKNSFDSSPNKFKEDLDKFSNDVKKVSNDFLYDNLPEEYADKLKKDFNDFSEYAGGVASNISENTLRKGGEFVNNKISKESQDKIKQHRDTISNSTKKFIEDTSNVIINIHQHRKKIKNEKEELRKKHENKIYTNRIKGMGTFNTINVTNFTPRKSDRFYQTYYLADDDITQVSATNRKSAIDVTLNRESERVKDSPEGHPIYKNTANVGKYSGEDRYCSVLKDDDNNRYIFISTADYDLTCMIVDTFKFTENKTFGTDQSIN